MKKTKTNCKVCGNLHHINFNQKKILRLKEEAYLMAESRDYAMYRLHHIYAKERVAKKRLSEAEEIYRVLKKKIYATIHDMEEKSKSIKSRV